jgi:hypothetical protein
MQRAASSANDMMYTEVRKYLHGEFMMEQQIEALQPEWTNLQVPVRKTLFVT